MLVVANIFQPLIDAFEAVLKFFHGGGISWGFSIVLLTICVRAVLVPLTLRQLRSMQKLQQLSPQLKALQAKYKEDKQRQQQEIMKFYKENNVNPLASCLPLVLQLPVFIGLFYTLRKNLRPDICPAVQHKFQQMYAASHHISLHAAAGQTTPCLTHGHGLEKLYHGGAGFLFVPDLTDKATGWVLAVLIVLYVGTQLVSTMMMSAPTMDNSQRRLFMLLPLFFVIFVINFPAGLIVYWITTNTWTMVQQYVIRRTMAPPVPVAAGPPGGPAGPAGGGGPGPDGGAPTNGAGSPGGLGATLRGLLKPPDAQEPTGVGSGRTRREAPPPPPPRKKKKRSGRRR